MTKKSKIIWTITDEAPALATYSFLPIVQAFTKTANIDLETKDISLAGRIIANFSDMLPVEQKTSDALSELGEIAKTPEANIVKLPNISASIPQLKNAIKELRSHGHQVPDFPEDPQTENEKEIRARYSKVLGSAVNPVLREGNSDRRVADAVKQYAKDNPHSMGEWSKNSKSHVAHMSESDFYASELSHTVDSDTEVKIIFTSQNGESSTLKEKTPLLAGEIIDSSTMNVKALCEFLEREIQDAKAQDILLSIHLKATMMKVSDPIIFGHAVHTYFKDVFDTYQSLFDELGVDQKNGLGDIFTKIQSLPEEKQNEIKAAIHKCLETRADMAMVDSDKGITNLHVPSDVIIDASMPAAIRASGQMWNKKGELQDTKYIIPDRCYAGIYEETINFCKENGAFDPKTMGSVSNIGLMAKKAQEYGSHDKTFEIKENGTVKVQDPSGKTLLEHNVQSGDIWRMCQTKDEAIKDWVKLGVTRARLTGNPAVFWLDEKRAHDSSLIQKVKKYLLDHDTNGPEVKILAPKDACSYTLVRVKEGLDTISVTGNVLRDYLTDLFPILELGTSAKMLSIVPLLNGGGLFETGAGGSAPKHVQQLEKENHLRWDSLGEFLALAVSLEDISNKNNNTKAKVLAEALNMANSRYLKENKSPSRKVREIDNRGSHFYLALYWAYALSKQEKDNDLKEKFTALYSSLSENEDLIINQLNDCQGNTVNMGGYYHTDPQKLQTIMRPSTIFNDLVNKF